MFSNNEFEDDLNGNNWMCGYKTSSSNEFISGLLEKSINNKKRTYSESENSNDDEPSVLQEGSESEQQSEEEVKEEVFDEEPCGEGEEDETLFDPNEPPKSVVSLCDDFLLTPIVRPNPTLSLPIQRPAPMIPELEKVTQLNESNIMANAKRRDVCIKSILRSMRRYYCGKLESMTSYLRKEKKIKLKHQTLIKCAQKIVTELGLSSLSENMTFYFCLFAYSCDMRKILEKSRVNQTYLRSSCACPNESSW